MAKLHFKYGTVSSGKTLHLLVTANNYEIQNKKVLVLIPEIDTRFGYGTIKTRMGIERKADILLGEEVHLFNIPKDISCILVDEAQFLSEEWIDRLRHISIFNNIPVICFGLKSDFKSKLFRGSKRLLEVADSIEEIKTICRLCGHNKSIINLKIVNNKAVITGPSVELGADEKYKPVCWSCYVESLTSKKEF